MNLGDLILIIIAIVVFIISAKFINKHGGDNNENNSYLIKLSLALTGVVVCGVALFIVIIIYLNTIKLW